MKITIFGTGYVGLVTGACLSDVGHHVVCVDVDAEKIERLNAGEIPIHEPGLDAIVARNVGTGTLKFITDFGMAVNHAQVQFIAVGTPPNENGAADLKYVIAVAESIGHTMTDRKVVVIKSTVPVGTGDRVREELHSALATRKLTLEFDVVSNPEFLKEGAAVNDFLRPDRIIVGSATEYSRAIMTELYEPFNRNHNRTHYMDVRSAELTKYAANAMLATKISFINEIANPAERLGANIEEIRHGIGADPRIGHHFIYPGLGYGGSCFPKDVQALKLIASDVGYDASLIKAVEAVNSRQKTLMFEKISGYFGGPGKLKGKRFAIWGLAFKPNTDDMREAPSRVLVEALWREGAHITAFDPVAMEEMARLYGERHDLALVQDKYAALEDADALVICTEWQQFRALAFDEMADRMIAKVIFDGRNLYEPERLKREGWTYLSIGRAPAYPRPQSVEQGA